MHPVSLPTPVGGRAAGFTLIESMVALAIFGILLAVGVPRMTDWVSATKAANAAGFYAEGFATARTQALANNSQSRLVFTTNANGQPDWQVDICFRSTATPCSTEGDWSTRDTAAKGAPAGAVNFRSIRRTAEVLPSSAVLKVTLDPGNGKDVYFTPLGWVDGARANPVTRIDLAPPTGKEGTFRKSAVVLTMLGVASVCDPDVGPGDSRRCAE